MKQHFTLLAAVNGDKQQQQCIECGRTFISRAGLWVCRYCKRKKGRKQ